MRIGQTVPGQAVDLFGGPTQLRTEQSNACLASWPSIGLTIRFFTFASDPCATGVALAVTITNQSAWRTALGLRVGHSVTRLRALYPQARLHTRATGGWDGYWLVTRNACKQPDWAYPALLARVRRGHVSAFVVSGSACTP